VADEFDSPAPRPAPTQLREPTGRRVLLPTLTTLAGLLFLGAVFTGVWTDRLWFSSVDYTDVFSTILFTRTALFLVLGLVFALVVSANIIIAYRTQPLVVPRPRRFDPVVRYREVIEPIKKRLVAAIAVLLGLAAGGVASGQWQTFVLWRHGQPFGAEDPNFAMDLGFFVFDFPWLRFLASFGFATLAISIIAVALVNYVYGGITLQDKNSRVATSTQVHLSVLVGLFVLLKAFAYWLDRFELSIADGGLVTGLTYTDENARIPGKNILIIIALICALLFFANVIWRSLLLPAIGLGLLALSSILVSGVWPAIMQSFQVNPSEPDREAPYIARNIDSTREAYALTGVEKVPYDAQTSLSAEELLAAADNTPGTRLLDPTLVSPAFEQLQQVRGYYSVPETLDVDRYVLEDNDQPQDVIIAARELNIDGLADNQRNWANDHTVYTHGYGVVAAKGNERGPGGEPSFVVEDIPLQSTDPSLEVDQPRIYFGEQSPEYSVVGAPEGASQVEVDTPQGSAGDDGEGDASTFTYDGEGGVPIGGIFNKALYALKFGEPNLVLSDRVNEESTIIYDREPRERVEKVAPWLTIDGNTYPAIVDGRIVWIVDGYTTSNAFPQAEKTSLDDATSDTLTDGTQIAALPADEVSYMRNSVKAVVDAYDGTVDLYEWDEEDPILATWREVFPGVVQDRSEISPELLEHLRYPEDLFKVQREVLQRYHVTDAIDFYNAAERWVVPEDPTSDTTSQPPYYLSVQVPGADEPRFSLTSVFAPNNRQNLASFVSVNADATDDSEEGYGTMQILSLPTQTQVPGPSQMSNQINTDDGLAGELFQFRQNNVNVLPGNLLTLPVGEGLLYVQPIYTQASGATGTYPVLQYVVASLGEDVGFGTSLDQALNSVLGIEDGEIGEPDPPTVPPPGEPDPPAGPGTDETLQQLLERVEERTQEALAALEENDLGAYQQANEELYALLEQISELQAEQGGADTPGEDGPGGADDPEATPPEDEEPPAEDADAG